MAALTDVIHINGRVEDTEPCLLFGLGQHDGHRVLVARVVQLEHDADRTLHVRPFEVAVAGGRAGGRTDGGGGERRDWNFLYFVLLALALAHMGECGRARGRAVGAAASMAAAGG